MKPEITQLAIIGPTASGKSDLAIKIAQKIDAYILSIDSLSIYKEIDIVSAKPPHQDLAKVKHFGINELHIEEYFSVDIFISLYKEVISTCQKENKNLIIVGGTSFYLKTLLEGLSEIPKITNAVAETVNAKLANLENTYNDLALLDPKYMQNISPNDRYRIEKALLIYEASNVIPTTWFKLHPPHPVIKNLKIYNIDVSREVLRERINKRTKNMFDAGLIDEVCFLEQKYTRFPHAMSSIGIVEVLEYLDAKVTIAQMLENIATHTAQLAKRQQIFNKTQFQDVTSAQLEALEAIIVSDLDS